VTFSTIGTETTTNQPVLINKTVRPQGLYIVGRQGTGKSGLLENLIIQDIKQGLGVCVIDPHYEGGIIDNIIARLPGREKDVILLNIRDYQYPFGLNLFSCSDLNDPVAFQEVVDRVMHIFEKLFSVTYDTPLLWEYVSSCIHTIVANPGYTMAEIPLLLTDKNSRQKLVTSVKKSEVLRFWQRYELLRPDEQEDRFSPTLRRVDALLQDITLHIVGQERSTIDFRSMMDESKILLVKLDSLRLSSVTNLIGSLFLAAFLTAAPTRQRRQNIFNIYADEFQNFATEDFVKLIEEARKFGIGITIAHQNRAQLELSNKQSEIELKKRVLNVGSLIVFCVPTDAQELAGQFDTTPPPAELRREETLTPVSNPFDWLLSGHTHINPVVSLFADGTLRKIHDDLTQEYIKGREKPFLSEFNSFLYRAMTSTDALSMLCEKSSLGFLLRLNDRYPFGTYYFGQTVVSLPDVKIVSNWYSNMRVDRPEPVNYVSGSIDMPSLEASPYNDGALDERMANALIAMIRALSENQFIQASAHFARLAEEKLRKRKTAYLAAYEPAYRRNVGTISLWFTPTHDYSYSNGKYYPPEEETEIWDNEFPRWMTEERAQFDTFIKEFRDFVLALAKEPITSGSGIYEMKPVGQITSDEMRNRIANQLVDLPDYTTRVKIKGDTEHTIQTIKPVPGLYGTLLQQRIADIQNRNRKDGFTRPRQEVEVEIRMRQDALIQAQQPQKIVQHLPQPQGRLMPVCNQCGSQNQPGAIFCNQCGKKL